MRRPQGQRPATCLALWSLKLLRVVMATDLLSLSSGERFNFFPRRIADNFRRVSADGLLPVCASLSLRRCSAEKGRSLQPLEPLPSAAFWLAVTIFTLPTAYGPRSPWRAMWYWWERTPRSSKWPEVSQISSHSSNVNSKAMPRRLAPALWTRYLLRGVAIRDFGIVNTLMFSVASGRAAVRRRAAAPSIAQWRAS